MAQLIGGNIRYMGCIYYVTFMLGSAIRAEDASFVSGVVICFQCLREIRPQEGGEFDQAWTTWSEGASAP